MTNYFRPKMEPGRMKGKVMKGFNLQKPILVLKKCHFSF